MRKGQKFKIFHWDWRSLVTVHSFRYPSTDFLSSINANQYLILIFILTCLGLGYSRVGNNNRFYIRGLGNGTPCTIPIRPHPITPTLTSLSSTAIFKADLLATVPKEGANPSTEEPARAYKRAITDSFILIDVQKLLEQDIDCWLMDGDEWMNLQWPKCRYAWRRLDSDQMQIIIVSSFLSWWWMHVDATWKTSVCGAPMFVKGFKVCVFPAAKSGLTSVISRWIEFFYREILSVIFITVDIVPLVKWVNRAVNRWTNVTWPYVD